MPLVVGVLIGVLVLYYFASRRDDHGQGDGAEAEEEEEELLQWCLGDREQAERLLALEMKKAPAIGRGEAARRAIRCLRRDSK